MHCTAAVVGNNTSSKISIIYRVTGVEGLIARNAANVRLFFCFCWIFNDRKVTFAGFLLRIHRNCIFTKGVGFHANKFWYARISGMKNSNGVLAHGKKRMRVFPPTFSYSTLNNRTNGKKNKEKRTCFRRKSSIFPTPELAGLSIRFFLRFHTHTHIFLRKNNQNSQQYPILR